MTSSNPISVENTNNSEDTNNRECSSASAKDDAAKIQLEISKLNEEIEDIRKNKSWLRRSVYNVKITEWITTAGALVLVGSACFSGIFSVSKERLEASRDRLTIEKTDLEQKKEKLASEITDGKKQLDDLNAKLAPFHEEQAALEKIPSFKDDGLSIFVKSITYPDLHCEIVPFTNTVRQVPVGTTTIQPQRPVANSALSRALDLSFALRKLTKFSSGDLIFDKTQIAKALSHPGLKSVRLSNVGASDDDFTFVNACRELQYLEIPNNKITTFDRMPRIASVVSLDLDNNPLKDDGLSNIYQVFPTVAYLRITSNQLTDYACMHLIKLDILQIVDVRGTKITAKGLQTLSGCKMLNTVLATKEQRAGVSKASLKRSLTIYDPAEEFDPPPVRDNAR